MFPLLMSYGVDQCQMKSSGVDYQIDFLEGDFSGEESLLILLSIHQVIT